MTSRYLSRETIARYRLSVDVVEACERVGMSDADVVSDVERIRNGQEAALLRECLDGADEEDGTADDWRDYVSSLSTWRDA